MTLVPYFLCVLASIIIEKDNAQPMLGFEEAVTYCKDRQSLVIDPAGITYPVYQKETWINIKRYTDPSDCTDDCKNVYINIERRVTDKPLDRICRNASNDTYVSNNTNSICTPGNVTSKDLNILLLEKRIRENVAYIINEFFPQRNSEKMCGFRQTDSKLSFTNCSIKNQFQCIKGFSSPFTVLTLLPIRKVAKPAPAPAKPPEVTTSASGISSCEIMSSSLGGVFFVIVIALIIALIKSRCQLHKVKNNYLEVVYRLEEDEHGYTTLTLQSNIDQSARLNEENSSRNTPFTIGNHHYTLPTGRARPQMDKDGNLLPTPSLKRKSTGAMPHKTLISTISDGYTVITRKANADYIHLIENEICNTDL